MSTSYPIKAILFLEFLDRNVYIGHPNTIETDFSGNMMYIWNYYPSITTVIEGYTIFLEDGMSIVGDQPAHLTAGDSFTVSYPVKVFSFKAGIP